MRDRKKTVRANITMVSVTFLTALLVSIPGNAREGQQAGGGGPRPTMKYLSSVGKGNCLQAPIPTGCPWASSIDAL